MDEDSPPGTRHVTILGGAAPSTSKCNAGLHAIIKDDNRIRLEADGEWLSDSQTSRMTQSPPCSTSSAALFTNMAFALAIVLAPISFVVGGLLDPVVHVTNGAANIVANLNADPFVNALHIASFVVGSFLLPISIIGIARLAMPRSPWLATIGGALGLFGWLPLAALTAQEDMTLQMARLSPSDQLATLWERFNSDATMTVFLVVYVVGHLAAYVLLAVALRRAGVIPAWAAWTLAASTPLTLAFFATRSFNGSVGTLFEALFCATFVIGSASVAYAAVTLSMRPIEHERAVLPQELLQENAS